MVLIIYSALIHSHSHHSSLFVTKKVQRRTLASGTYPNALLPSTALALRAPPPVLPSVPSVEPSHESLSHS